MKRFKITFTINETHTYTATDYEEAVNIAESETDDVYERLDGRYGVDYKIEEILDKENK